MTDTHEALIAALELKKTALARRCIDAMYIDPFWQARFGERGRRHAEDDSQFHVKYLAAALREQDTGIFRHYAVWLRGVLTARGMCSWHLAESFRQLELALSTEGIERREPAASVLHAGAQALRYGEGAAGELQAHRESLLADAHSGAVCYRIDELLSFLLDGLARGDTQSLPTHVAFLAQSVAQSDTERQALVSTLRALRSGSARLPQSPAAQAAQSLLDRALF